MMFLVSWFIPWVSCLLNSFGVRRLCHQKWDFAAMILTNSRWAFVCIDLAERSHNFRLQGLERHPKCLGPREDYIIMPRPSRKRFEQP